MRCLNETEEIGVNTARELVEQGDKLRAIDERLDHVDNTLSATQKNINSLKSIFGNLFTRNKQPVKPKDTITPSNSFTKKPIAPASDQQVDKASHAIVTGSDREQELNKVYTNLNNDSQIISDTIMSKI